MEQEEKEKIREKIEENYKFNFWINIGDGAFYTLGLGLVAINTILPLFVRQLTESKFLVSLIVAIHMFGIHFPQLFSAKWIKRAEIKKKYVLLIGIFQRLPWLFLAVLTYLLFPDNQSLLLIAFFILWGFENISSGLVGPPWFDMVFKVIPQERRGRFFGYRTFMSSILEVLGAFGAGYIIKFFEFRMGFILLFALAFISKMISYLFLVFIKEPAYNIEQKEEGTIEYLQHLKEILQSQNNYRNYILAAILVQFIGMSNGLFTVAGIERLDLSVEVANDLVGTFTIISIASKSLTNILWGYVGDNYGHKLVILLAAVFNATGVLVAFFAQQRFAFYLVFVLTGIALGGNSVSFMTIIPDFCPELEERPLYIGLTNTIVGLTVTIISLLGGLLVDLYNYRLVFAITFVMISLGAIFLMFKVDDPKYENNCTES
ncbi:MFS transporter [Natroniella sulfidigena]|uniref:MFS transporter n=1 Tax=Natroniella sulfidigena TaxID=723921 RepID=UPI00200A1430|nr:MFS transporter [Natroniella sulfidigena]MCK8817231.1 MFS transporter [Natroniella sulfidigena]